MATPILGVEIDFANGPAFGYPIVLDDAASPLDVGILGLAPADIVDITSQVLKASTRRGRNRILSNFEAGTATVTLNDPNSDFSPTNTSGQYYGKLLPLRKIRIWADLDTGGATPLRIYIFSGYITSYDTSFYQGTNETSTVVLQCVDGFRLLNNVSTGPSPIPGATAGQSSGTRVNELLDFATWPNSMRKVDPGDSTLQADPGENRSVLQAIQTVEQSEFGGFFINREGDANFFSRDKVAVLADQDPKIYADNAIDGYLYSNLDFAYDDQLILNDVTVTRYNDGTLPAPVPQTVEDPASIDTYFYKSGQRNGILVQTDQESLDQALTIVASRKDANLRIDSMTLNLMDDYSTDRIKDTLSMEIYRICNITKTMPGGSIVTRELFCQGVQHDVSPGKWSTKILTAEPIIQAFILDSDDDDPPKVGQGILDRNALTY